MTGEQRKILADSSSLAAACPRWLVDPLDDMLDNVLDGVPIRPGARVKRNRTFLVGTADTYVSKDG
jgi:hypothetical protein